MLISETHTCKCTQTFPPTQHTDTQSIPVANSSSCLTVDTVEVTSKATNGHTQRNVYQSPGCYTYNTCTEAPTDPNLFWKVKPHLSCREKKKFTWLLLSRYFCWSCHTNLFCLISSESFPLFKMFSLSLNSSTINFQTSPSNRISQMSLKMFSDTLIITDEDEDVH